MKIRVWIYLNSVISTIMVTLLFIMLFFSYRDTRIELKKSEMAGELAMETTNLVIITNNYLENHYEREAVQWESEFKNIMELIDKNSSENTLSIQAELESLRHNFSRLKYENNLKLELLKRKARTRELEKIESLVNMLRTQIQLSSKKIISDVFNISINADKEIQVIQRQKNFYVLSFVMILLIIIVVNSSLTIKKITIPLKILLEGANMISKGRLDYKIKKITGKRNITDEVGELTDAFNNMAKSLNETFQGLELEIIERKKAQDRVKQSLGEKEILLKEIHHRVKNNMQVISSLLSLQSEYVINDHDRKLFIESVNRVRSMAMVHELLYQTEDLSKISLNELINNLVNKIGTSYNQQNKNINIIVDSENLTMEITKAVPCALIINELISNSFKHAFETGSEGEIKIIIKRDSHGMNTIIFIDNGTGLPDNIDFNNIKSLGFKLMLGLVQQIKGTIDFKSENGFNATIIFPV